MIPFVLIISISSVILAFIMVVILSFPLRSSRRSLKYRLFASNLSLIEFVRKKRSVSPLTEPFLKLRGGTKRNACIGTFL